MKVVSFNVYTFDELSDDVRKKIVERECFSVMEDAMEGHDYEYKDSLSHFEEATGFRAGRWDVGYGEHNFRIYTPDYNIMGTDGYPVYAEECIGKLLFRWCRDFIERNAKGKYYGKLIPHAKDKEHPAGLEHIYRHSKVLIEPIEGGWCPWTGCCTDCPLVEPIVDFYRNYHRGKFSESYSLKDLIDDCFEKFFSEWQSEYDAYGDNVDGCVEEFISINSDGDWYLEDGTKAYIPCYAAI